MRNWRINIIFVLIMLFGAAIIGRLIFIQIIKYDYYKALAQGQQKIFQPVKGDRGEVFLKGGQILATNISQSGIIFRKYPQEFMAASVIGFLGGEGRGQYGLEGYYDEVLQGREYLPQDASEDATVQGSDICLSLDYNIQFMSEKLLRQAKEDLNIEGGQIIVMEPNTGKILALADFPDFDPNQYYQADDFQVFQNLAIQGLFEPGSVFKAITIAGALDQGKITPETTYFDEGKVTVADRTFINYNGRVFGLQNMTQVLEKSINTGAIFVEEQLGNELFLDYVKRFGFFERTGIDLQGEIFSENKELKRGYQVNFSSASFGQGVEITPIQLVRAFSAIANGGKLVKPYLAESVIEGDKIIKKNPEISLKPVISQRTASQLTAMLVSVIENGFSQSAKIPGYYIAGKTGTAQVSWSSLGKGSSKEGYSDKTWQSFIGFGPAFNARFLILVKLDNPETNTAEYSAVPIFQELAKYIIDYLEIPPDYDNIP